LKRSILILGILLILLGGTIGYSTAQAEMPSNSESNEIQAGECFLGNIPGNTIGGGRVIFSSPMSEKPVVILTLKSSNAVSSKFFVWLGEVSLEGFVYTYLTESEYSLNNVYLEWIAICKQ